MIYFDREEAQMLNNAAETMKDRIACEPDEYTAADMLAVDNIDHLSKAVQQSGALVLTGDALPYADAKKMMAQVIQAELDHWIPNASQRLIYRASRALDVRVPVTLSGSMDCGAEPGWHALVADWVAGIYVRRCVTCERLYADGTRV